MLTNEQINSVKSRGFLRNRGTELFSGRIVPVGTVFTAEDFKNLAVLSEKFGNGKLFATSRLSVEIPGIPFEKIEEAEAFAASVGLAFGGTGPKVRPITACKGTTCVFGNCDTQAIAAKIHKEFYLGWSAVKLPHKFKIGVGGCPNSCMKPSLNDFGIEGRRAPVYDPQLCRGCKVCSVESRCPTKAARLENGKLNIDKEACLSCGVCTGKCPFGAVANESETKFAIYVGGTWGKSTRMGSLLSRFVSEEEILPLIEKAILWFRENGLPKERFGKTVDRVGIGALEAALFSDDIIKRKEDILAK